MADRVGSIGERRLLRTGRPVSMAEFRLPPAVRRNAWLTTSHLAVVVGLLCLAAANLYTRWTWSEMEDGVLWEVSGNAVTASEVAPGSPAAKAGIRSGDILASLNGQEVFSASTVTDALH